MHTAPCEGAIVVPGDFPLERISDSAFVKEKRMAVPGMKYDAIRLAHTIDLLKGSFLKQTEKLGIPHIHWHPTQKMHAVSDSYELLVAAGVSGNEELTEAVWKKAKRNRLSAVVLAEDQDPDPILQAVLGDLNRGYARAFVLPTNNELQDEKQLSVICETALKVSYLLRHRN